MSGYYSLPLMPPYWNQTPELYAFPAKLVPLWIVWSLQDIAFSLGRLARTCCLHCSKVGKSTAVVCHSVLLVAGSGDIDARAGFWTRGRPCAYCTVPKSPRSAILNFSHRPTSSFDVLLNMEILLHLLLARICVYAFHPGG